MGDRDSDENVPLRTPNRKRCVVIESDESDQETPKLNRSAELPGNTCSGNRSSERIRSKKSRVFKMPDRRTVLDRISDLEGESPRKVTRPRKLDYQYSLQNHRYNAEALDPGGRSAESDMEDFIVDDLEDLDEIDRRPKRKKYKPRSTKQRVKRTRRISQRSSSSSSDSDEPRKWSKQSRNAIESDTESEPAKQVDSEPETSQGFEPNMAIIETDSEAETHAENNQIEKSLNRLSGSEDEETDCYYEDETEEGREGQNKTVTEKGNLNKCISGESGPDREEIESYDIKERKNAQYKTSTPLKSQNDSASETVQCEDIIKASTSNGSAPNSLSTIKRIGEVNEELFSSILVDLIDVPWDDQVDEDSFLELLPSSNTQETGRYDKIRTEARAVDFAQQANGNTEGNANKVNHREGKCDHTADDDIDSEDFIKRLPKSPLKLITAKPNSSIEALLDSDDIDFEDFVKNLPESPLNKSRKKIKVEPEWCQTSGKPCICSSSKKTEPNQCQLSCTCAQGSSPGTVKPELNGSKNSDSSAVHSSTVAIKPNASTSVVTVKSEPLWHQKYDTSTESTAKTGMTQELNALPITIKAEPEWHQNSTKNKPTENEEKIGMMREDNTLTVTIKAEPEWHQSSNKSAKYCKCQHSSLSLSSPAMTILKKEPYNVSAGCICTSDCSTGSTTQVKQEPSQYQDSCHRLSTGAIKQEMYNPIRVIPQTNLTNVNIEHTKCSTSVKGAPGTGYTIAKNQHEKRSTKQQLETGTDSSNDRVEQRRTSVKVESSRNYNNTNITKTKGSSAIIKKEQSEISDMESGSTSATGSESGTGSESRSESGTGSECESSNSAEGESQSAGEEDSDSDIEVRKYRVGHRRRPSARAQKMDVKAQLREKFKDFVSARKSKQSKA